MKILVISNFSNQKAGGVYVETVNVLLKLGCEVIVTSESDKISNETVMRCSDAYKKCDRVIAIGGDGSIIHVAKKAAAYRKPVLGINCGRLGYLSGLEADNLSRLNDFVSGNYTVECRSMLTAEFTLRGKKVKKSFLNDAVIAKGAISRMVDLKVGFDNNFVDYHADGVIVSTSTGATAYSMSAGGPIVAPDLDLILVTPISAHSFHNRSIALSVNTPLSITNNTERHSDVYLSIDGEQAFKLGKNDVVTISRSPLTAQIIKIDNVPFFETLSNKIR